MELVGASPFVEFFDPVPSGGLSSLPPPPYLNLPKPYDRVLDMNIERQSIVYEVVLNRDIGFQIVEGPDGLPMVGEVTPGSKSEKFGVLKGDYITSTSATAGDSLWTHNTADGVKSAITTRFVMSSSVTVRFERPLSAIPKEIQEKIHVPYQYVVRVKRPIGIHVIEAALPYDPEKEENGRAVLVQYLKPELGAARSKRIEIGDQIIAMSASWGDRLWAVNSVESFVVGVKMRTDKQLSFKLRRMVPLEVYSGQLQGRLQRAEKKKINSKETSLAVSSGAVEDIHLLRESSSIKIADVVDRLTNASSLQALWKFVREADGGKMLSSYNVNKLMSAALRLERPDLAAQIFEVSFGFFFDPVANPAKALMKVINEGAPVSFRRTPIYENEPMLAVPLTPNNFVATTAVKAYGRLKEPRKALAILPWLESGGARGAGVEPDVYFMSALLYVCAKEKMVNEAEKLFWQEIPRRNLTYSIVTTNSLMYMYAKLNRPEDALKVYDLAKGLNIQCTVITYGVLIKALMKSGKKKLEEASYEILHSLPSMGIAPGVEVYNQFFEHYSKTHNYRQTKGILRLMSSSAPKVKPDAVSYGYMINCFADSKKPRSAIAAFHQMTKRRIPPNGYTYMGVLKALSHMRDGLSAVQVLSEMKDRGILPDKRHYSMAMFTCVTAGQYPIAESIFSSYLRSSGEKPDTALYTLLLRAFLQQGKWTEGNKLFAQMNDGRDGVAPANAFTIGTMLQYQILNERWKEASNTFELAMQANSNRDAQLFSSLSFALSSYSAQVVRMHQEDLVAKQNAEGGTKAERSFTDFTINNSPLPPPSQEALQFLMNCVIRISKDTAIIIPEVFYTELLKGLVLEGITSSARKLLELRGSGVIKIKTDDEEKLAGVESLAMRALKKMAGISAKENAKVLEHLSEGKELRESNAELYQYDEDDYSSDSLDDQLDQ